MLTVKAGQSCQWEAMNKKRNYLGKIGSDNVVNKCEESELTRKHEATRKRAVAIFTFLLMC